MPEKLRLPVDVIERLARAYLTGRVYAPVLRAAPRAEGGFHLAFATVHGSGDLAGSALLPVFSSKEAAKRAGFLPTLLVGPSPRDLAAAVESSTLVVLDLGSDPTVTVALSDFVELWDHLHEGTPEADHSPAE